jgi:hypothetical protein
MPTYTFFFVFIIQIYHALPEKKTYPQIYLHNLILQVYASKRTSKEDVQAQIWEQKMSTQRSRSRVPFAKNLKSLTEKQKDTPRKRAEQSEKHWQWNTRQETPTVANVML